MPNQLTNTRLGPLSDEPGSIKNVLYEFIAARGIVGFSGRGDLAKEIYSILVSAIVAASVSIGRVAIEIENLRTSPLPYLIWLIRQLERLDKNQCTNRARPQPMVLQTVVGS